MSHAAKDIVSRWTLPFIGILIPCLLCTSCTQEPIGSVNLNTVVIVTAEGDSAAQAGAQTAATVLSEEVHTRTGLTWQVAATDPGGGVLIRLTTGPESGIEAEGFRISTEREDGRIVIEINGADGRGTLFGAGYLLRKLHWRQGSASLPEPINITTSPAFPMRGHQIGYRNLANTYDAWDVAKYDQYIRELALFGTNCIENIPFHQLDEPSPHFPLPQLEMNTAMSGVCQRYGLGFWMFIPATEDLADEEYHAEFLRMNAEAYAACPSVEAVFVPGGDPGNNHPRLLLPVLEELNGLLRENHPEAGIWVSLQKFEPEKTEYFFSYVNENRPDYIAGIVDGPWGPAPNVMRERLGNLYPMRIYPDINHNVRCQFPVPWWDPALAMTLGREASNPRPVGFSQIFQAYVPGTTGFLTYSDGVHDDVNKFVWSALGWNPNADMQEVLTDYARLFFGPDVAEDAARGILGLERNWIGALAENTGVDSTLALWQRLETDNPQLADNWRWQQCLLRAYYDAYIRHRLIYEERLEAEAVALLEDAFTRGPVPVVNEAKAILARAETEPINQEWRRRIEELCDALFQSIGMQTSVERHGAMGAERGAVLDFVDLPLNDRWWLEDQFRERTRMFSGFEAAGALNVLAKWENPREGSFYDDIGNVAKSPHVVRPADPSADPMLLETPFPFFMWKNGGRTRERHSWQSDIHWPTMRYENLDPNAEYTIRVTGKGPLYMRFDGELVWDGIDGQTGEVRTDGVPQRFVQDSTLVITWDNPDEGNIHWRQWSRVNEVWLIKNEVDL